LALKTLQGYTGMASNNTLALADLRQSLVSQGIDAFLVPSTDPHHAEWVTPAARRLERLTGFKGSAGTALVLQDRLLLLTDGRYTTVAAAEIPARPLEIINVRDQTLEQTLAVSLPTGTRLGYDPWLHTVADIGSLGLAAAAAGISLVAVTENPIDRLLPPPSLPAAAAYPHPLQYTGRSSADKCREVAEHLGAIAADRLFLSAPESICWLLNIRGEDHADTPLVYAFAQVHLDASVDLYLDPRKSSPGLVAALGHTVRLHAYADIKEALAEPGNGRTLALDPASTSEAVASIAIAAAWKITTTRDPCVLPKGIKTAVEIAGAKACHRREGLLLCRFWQWLEAHAHQHPLTESVIRAEIDRLRATDPLFRSPSFETIPASGPNAALPHYHVSPETDRELAPGEFLLLDSGGQYRDGTTDITRTFALGEPTLEMKERYTLVLKSFIRAAAARFPRLTRGIQIDTIARELFWRAGVDFDHSLGHGVGSFLGVHEGPNRLRPNLTGLEPLQAGMITSIEPAFYALGRFGVRIENLAVIVELPAAVGDEMPLLGFEQLTLCPIDVRPALHERLTAREKAWLNAYHHRVWTELSVELSGPALAWLAERTVALH